LIVYCFTSRLRIFHLYRDITIAVEWLQNFGLCSALRAFDQGESLSCHTCCDTGPRFFGSHPKVRPIQSPLMTRIGIRRTHSNPDYHREGGRKRIRVFHTNFSKSGNSSKFSKSSNFIRVKEKKRTISNTQITSHKHFIQQY
jgi:hypothetical protein